MVLPTPFPNLLMLARVRLRQPNFQLASGDIDGRPLAVLDREPGGGVLFPPQPKADSTTDRAQSLTDNAYSRIASNWKDCVGGNRRGHARRGSGGCVLAGLVQTTLDLDTFSDDLPARGGAGALPNVAATVGANLRRIGFDDLAITARICWFGETVQAPFVSGLGPTSTNLNSLQPMPVHACGGCGATTAPCQVLSRSVCGPSQAKSGLSSAWSARSASGRDLA